MSDINNSKRILLFSASFNVGTPINVFLKDKFAKWDEIRHELIEQFKKKPIDFQIINANYDNIASFPAGTPVFIRSERFEDIFKIEKYLHDKQLFNNDKNIDFTNEIWICPSGIVLLIGKLHFQTCADFTIEKFDKVIQAHYSELSFLFISIAEVIYSTILDNAEKRVFCNKADAEQIIKIIDLKTNFSSTNTQDNDGEFANTFRCLFMNSSTNNYLLESILNDVYFIDFYENPNEPLIDINYFRTTLKISRDEFLNYSIVILITFSCFWEFIWLNRYLNERTSETQSGLFNISSISYQTIAELKLIRLYILHFFNESSPINIRLTREYMKCMEECWNRFRMHELAAQIKDQLNTLMEMIDWYDGIHREIRNYKIGAVGLIFTLLSFLAIASDLSDIFFSPVINMSKLIYVISGGVIGIIITIAILIFPIHKRYPRLKSYRKKDLF